MCASAEADQSTQRKSTESTLYLEEPEACDQQRALLGWRQLEESQFHPVWRLIQGEWDFVA
jgi:hypothetical protein